MKKNLITAIKKLSVDEREDLMDSMALKSDQDFWNTQHHQPGCGQYVHAECTLSEWIQSIYVFLYKLHMQWPNKLPSWTVEQQKISSATIPGNNWGLDDRNSMNPSQYTMLMGQKTRKAKSPTTAGYRCYTMDSSNFRKFFIMALRRDRMILGYPFLQEFNLQINWADGKLKGGNITLQSTKFKYLKWVFRRAGETLQKTGQLPKWIIAFLRCTNLAQGWNRLEEMNHTHMMMETIPKEFRRHWKVFLEELSKWFPPKRDPSMTIKFLPNVSQPM
jgi:hypothetical protein